MTTTTIASRRSFIWTAGAALSAPLAAVAATLPAGADAHEDPVKTRLAMLEDVNAIRALNQAYARHVNEGARQALAALFADSSDARLADGVVRVAADGFGEQDVIEIAADRATATARVHCMVETAEIIGPSCPLVEMAREQGGGFVRRTERGVFAQAYVKRDGVWKIQRSMYLPV